MDVSRHNWSLRIEDDEVSMSLGNWTDAGWQWDDEGWENMPGFLWRIARSKVAGEFLLDMIDQALSYDEIKAQVLPHVAQELYIVSGDNNEWKFGGTESDLEGLEENFQEQNGLTDEQMERVKEEAFNNWDTTFDAFEKTSYADAITQIVLKIFEDADTFQDLFDAINSDDTQVTILEIIYSDFKEGRYWAAMEQAKKKLRIR